MIEMVYIDPTESNDQLVARRPDVFRRVAGGIAYVGSEPRVALCLMDDARAANEAAQRHAARGG